MKHVLLVLPAIGILGLLSIALAPAFRAPPPKPDPTYHVVMLDVGNGNKIPFPCLGGGILAATQAGVEKCAAISLQQGPTQPGKLKAEAEKEAAQ